MPKRVKMVRDDTPGLLLIAAVIQVPNIEYVLDCDDPFKLAARLPRIRDMVHARVDAQVLNEHQIRLTLTPVDGLLTLGITPVRGERLLLSTDQARAAIGHDLMLADRQAYALRVPVPGTISSQAASSISPSDSAATVLSKYHDATTPATVPSTLPSPFGSSGRVVIPGTPTSQPGRPRY